VAYAKPQVTQPPARGVAHPIDTSTRPVPTPEATAPVFVDHSGRRGRALRRVVYILVAVALVLLALLWLSQASVVGPEVP
jgi:hypothetical protein